MDIRAQSAPSPLIAAVSLVGVEALLLAMMGVIELFAFNSARAAMGLTTTVFFLGYALALAFCALQLARLHSWARSPVVLAQLIQLGVAWSFRGGETGWVAIGLAVLALLVLAGIFHPASIDAVSDDPA